MAQPAWRGSGGLGSARLGVGTGRRNAQGAGAIPSAAATPPARPQGRPGNHGRRSCSVIRVRRQGGKRLPRGGHRTAPVRIGQDLSSVRVIRGFPSTTGGSGGTGHGVSRSAAAPGRRSNRWHLKPARRGDERSHFPLVSPQPAQCAVAKCARTWPTVRGFGSA